MRAMKNLSVNRMMGSVRRRASPSYRAPNGASPDPQADTPEANASRGVTGEEVLYLPTIVESAESSPTAAAACAYGIRKFLSNDNSKQPHIQYNAIMLIRILSDNPGKSFTKHVDAKFVAAVKALLRESRDPSVRQILMETLLNLEREKGSDENLRPLMEMWKKEESRIGKSNGSKQNTGPSGTPGPQPITSGPSLDLHSQNYFSSSHQPRRQLPNPNELASRIEEARNSAKLLTQVVQSTPPSELLQDELVREFANRCQSASRSMQGYMLSEEPAPDNDTMLTLIETNEQLVLAMSRHQRAILGARKVLGVGKENVSGKADLASGGVNAVAPPLGPPPGSYRTSSPPQLLPTSLRVGAQESLASMPPSASPEDPFQDRFTVERRQASSQRRNSPQGGQFPDRLGIEPYHPGFNPTTSYMARQDSATDKVAMHAAAISAEVQGGEQRHEMEGSTPEQQHEDDDAYDAYDASPVQPKAPVYRY
ncbi:MAG: hypothetical protein M1818_007617 [Claussenomyces sp. TS43310]|nr:MAG: hypothetical protein M1818_007617 [Claussenomyces sp. TS43310]